MARSADARRLRTIALVCAAFVVVAIAAGVGKNVVGGAWFAFGAVVASLISAATVWRLASVAQEWRRELRQARALNAKLDAENTKLHLENKMMMESIEQALFICDSAGVIREANAAAKELFDFAEPIGRTLLAVTLSYEIQNLAQLAATERNAQRQTFQVSYPKSRYVRVLAWKPQTSELVYVTIHDETELRRLEQVRTDFVANVSHELRTPMATLRAMAETIHDDPHMPVPKLQRYTAQMIKEVDRLTNISEDLLTLATAESKPIQKEAIDLTQVIHYSVEQVAERAAEQGLELRTSIAEELCVLGDQNQLVQVFLNLLTNAIRYTQQGYVDIQAQRNGDFIEIVVSDSGIGIAQEHLSRIFERFYRVDRARSRDTGGTGLGLSIVKHIVDAHGGKVSVESELNVGTKFKVKLPAYVPPAVD